MQITISVLGQPPQDVWMLVDSGADNTTIPLALAEALAGVPVAQFGPPAYAQTGLGGGATDTWLLVAELSYRGTVFATRVSSNIVPRPVLGREDFMKFFDVQFQWGNKPPEFQVALNRSAVRTKNLAIRTKGR